MAHVICLGEAMVELSLSSQAPSAAQIAYAGDTLNTAIYLKRARPKTRVSYATKVGKDSFSHQMRALMHTEGLDLSLVLESPDREPGLYSITTDSAGERSFNYWRSASAARDLLRPPALGPEHLMAADMVYLSAISLAILPPEDRTRLLDWIADYRRSGGLFVFDSNYRPKLWDSVETAREVVSYAWSITDLGLPSVDDEMALFGDRGDMAVLDRLRSLGLQTGALKRGHQGPIAIDGSPASGFAPAATVIDSTAAGDSFNAGYLAAYLGGEDQAACLHAGHALASRVVSVRGAIIPKEAQPA